MKRGITLSIMSVAIIIIMIVVSTATIVGVSSIDTANFEEYQSKIQRVKDNVEIYYEINSQLPVNNIIISKEDMTQDLLKEIIQNGDETSDMYIVDMNLLNIIGINIGFGDITDKDIFVVSEDSFNVYYYKGFNYKNKLFYNNN